MERERLSIDVSPIEHRRIKAYAALHGQTIREYVMGSLRKQLQFEEEKKELAVLANHLDQDPVLNNLWDNDQDATYDKI